MPKVEEFARFDADADRQGDLTRYPGTELHVLYERGRCMHAAECGRASKAVFDGKRSPWIQPDEIDADKLVAIVQRCPTGALRAVRPDGGEVAQEAPPANEVAISPDGPIYIRGRLSVEHADGTMVDETRVALCRCGASHYKPFCDGTHARVRFGDAGGVDRDPEGNAPVGGTLAIKLAGDGPLLLDGPMTLRAASGRPASYAGKCALCRCGSSKTKPFCDGSHKAVGWKATPGDGR